LNIDLWYLNYVESRGRMRKVWLISVLAISISLIAGSNVVIASPAAYVVKAGDTLWNIANSNGLSIDSVKQLNGLSSETIHTGQLLILSNPAVIQTVPSNPAAISSSQYIIQAGDTLWNIALKYGTTVDKLKAINGLTNNMIFAGDTLQVGITSASTNISRGAVSFTGSRVVAKAEQYLGTPYRYGGAAPGGFDCSGFVQYILGQFQVSLNRTAASQYNNGVAVNKDSLVSGDLVFFNTYGGISHVGIYTGNGSFIHSSSSRSGGVIYSSLSEGYYAQRYVGARRVIR
jgi:cell wall-associated NlpC family hydrolase